MIFLLLDSYDGLCYLSSKNQSLHQCSFFGLLLPFQKTY
jgi:hypothetical protein